MEIVPRSPKLAGGGKIDRRSMIILIGIIVACAGALLFGPKFNVPDEPEAQVPGQAHGRGLHAWISESLTPPPSARVAPPNDPLTFNQFMGLLKKETPKPVADKVVESYKKNPALMQALEEFTKTPEAGERPASEFVARLGNLPEFHGLASEFHGSAGTQAAFQHLASLPQVDSALRAAFPQSASASGTRGDRRSHRAFSSDSRGLGGTPKAGSFSEQGFGSGVNGTKMTAVPSVGNWKDAFTGEVAGAPGTGIGSGGQAQPITGGGAVVNAGGGTSETPQIPGTTPGGANSFNPKISDSGSGLKVAANGPFVDNRNFWEKLLDAGKGFVKGTVDATINDAKAGWDAGNKLGGPVFGPVLGGLFAAAGGLWGYETGGIGGAVKGWNGH